MWGLLMATTRGLDRGGTELASGTEAISTITGFTSAVTAERVYSSTFLADSSMCGQGAVAGPEQQPGSKPAEAVLVSPFEV